MQTKSIGAFTFMIIGSLLLSCTPYLSWHGLDETLSWESTERAEFKNGEKLISQHLDSKSSRGESFYLYYFTTEVEPMQVDYSKKTILFIAGGPGHFVQRIPQGEREGGARNFLDIPGYRVVYFHLRGSGFSQIPESHNYDRYLRTKYAVEDIERIRRLLLGENKWAGVVGHSYGTVLAQQYAASKYGKYVGSLVLSAPQSRHQFKATSGAEAKKQLLTSMREVHTHNLDEISTIYQQEFLGFLDVAREPSHRREAIMSEISKVLEDVDIVFGQLSLLVDSYPELERKYTQATSQIKEDTYKRLLDYDQSFFRALQKIRQVGWIPNVRLVSHWHTMIGYVIGAEILERRFGVPVETRIKEKLGLANEAQSLCELRSKLDSDEHNEGNLIKKIVTGYCGAKEELKKGEGGRSKRVFYVITIYDGLDMNFLEAPVAPNDLGIVRMLTAWRMLGFENLLAKVGLWPGDDPQPWDPADYPHSVPTLILKGGADPVSAGGAAEHIYKNALKGIKVFVEFPGIGHEMRLPETDNGRTEDDKMEAWAGCAQNGNAFRDARDCLLDVFFNDPSDNTNRRKVLNRICRQLNINVKAQQKNHPELTVKLWDEVETNTALLFQHDVCSFPLQGLLVSGDTKSGQ